MIDFEESMQLLREFIRFDTTNPPGNEKEAALFLENILRNEGVDAEVHVPVPDRANLVARIEGKRRGKPIVLLGHIDVVPAKEEQWEVSPFEGTVKNGFLYGRGTIDMKTQVICQLLAFRELARERLVPENDVVLLATCDEEVGGVHGAKYMLDNIAGLRDASFVMSEGGYIMEENGSLHAPISVNEKQLSQFMLRAHGPGGHGSTPQHTDNPNEKIVNASKAILSYEWPFKPTGVITAYMDGIFKGMKGKDFTYTTLKEAVKNPKFQDFIKKDPFYNALLRNTVTLTILKGGEKVNVIPQESDAVFDARLLPTEKHDAFFKRIRKLCSSDIEVMPIGYNGDEPRPSGFNTKYFKVFKRVIQKQWGDIPVLPCITTGATDLRYFRDLGIPAYGFFPAVLPTDELLRMHGVNERISVENVKHGVESTYEIVKALAMLR